MNEYPKQMRFVDGDVVTVLAPPNHEGYCPAQFADGRYGIPHESNLSPLPSPDDVVEVVVKMTRALRDDYASFGGSPVFVDACRAHKEAEA